jgi:protein-disulfide isomerase
VAKKKIGGGLGRFYIILAVVAVIGIGAVGYMIGSSASTAAEPVDIAEVEGAELVRLAQGMVMGEDGAPITIYEFGDYQCPACRTWALQVKPLLKGAYIDSGQARLVFYDWPITQIHPNAFLAARASRCAADQGLYWQYHDALFQNQTAWAGSGSPTGQFTAYAEEVGADKGEFTDCLRSDRHADVVTAQMRLGEQLGVTGTPTVMISKGDGTSQRPDRLDFQGISEFVEGLLAN